MREPDSARGDVVIHASRGKLLGLAAIGAIFFAIGIWLFGLWSSQGCPVATLPVVAVLSLLMGLAGAGYALFRLVVRKPAVVLTAEGLYDNASAVAVGFVAWGAIETLVLYRQQNQIFLGAIPRDIPAFLAAQGPIKRVLLRASLRLGAPPIAIPQGILPMPARELALQIASRYSVRVLLE